MPELRKAKSNKEFFLRDWSRIPLAMWELQYRRAELLSQSKLQIPVADGVPKQVALLRPKLPCRCLGGRKLK